MNLKLITNTPHPEFEVIENDKTIMRLKIDNETESFRMKLKDSRRVFLLVEEKFRKNNIVTLVSEYSQPLGTLVKSKIEANSGTVEIEGLQLNYKIVLNPLKEIILFRDSLPGVVLSCTIQNDIFLSVNDEYINYFLFALSWFAFSSKEKKQIREFSEA